MSARLGQHVAAGLPVEAADDLVCLLDDGCLVLADRHHGRLEGRDVGRLGGRVAQEPRRDVAAEAARLDFVLDRRVALKPGDGDEVEVEHREFGQRRQGGLDAEGRGVRVDAHGQVVSRHFQHVAPDLAGSWALSVSAWASASSRYCRWLCWSATRLRSDPT